MSPAVQELQSALDGQPKPDCAALTPFTVEEADFDLGRVVLLFAPQPAFKNHFGNVQGGFAVAMVDVLASVAAYAKTNGNGCRFCCVGRRTPASENGLIELKRWP